MIRVAVTALAIVLAASAQADEASHYSDCMTIVRAKPQAALDTATGWRADNGGVPAMHCQALALIELGQPARAAAILDAARAAMEESKDVRAGPLAAMLAAQAGNAWLLANEPARARDRMTQALALYEATSRYRLEALIDRARAQVELKSWEAAEADLTAALAMDADRADALLFRATARRIMGNLKGADVDIVRAGVLAPRDGDILVERGAIRAAQGRLDEARADWQLAAKITGSPAAKRATAALAALESGQR
jgi:tetratricopeptide (TPR) repeat protein